MITQKYEQSYNSKAMNSKSQIAFGNNKEVLSNKTEMQISLSEVMAGASTVEK